MGFGVEVGDEVGVRVAEPGMLLVGRLLVLQRPVPGVLNGQCRRDHQYLA